MTTPTRADHHDERSHTNPPTAPTAGKHAQNTPNGTGSGTGFGTGRVLTAALATGLLALTGVTLAALSPRNQMTVTVDGVAQTVRTGHHRVADVLADAGVRVSSEDQVTPSLTSQVPASATINVVHAKPVNVVIDGTHQRRNVAALTVADAIAEVSPRRDATVHASRSTTRTLIAGTTIEVRNPQQVTVVADGKTRALTTTRATASDVLAEAGIAVDGNDVVQVTRAAGDPADHTRPDPAGNSSVVVVPDKAHLGLGESGASAAFTRRAAETYPAGVLARVAVPAGQFVRSGDQVQVVRIDTRTVTTSKKLPFTTTTRKDSNLSVGRRRVVTVGKVGALVRTVRQHLADGKVTGQEVTATHTVEPVTQVVAVGTKAHPAPKPTRASSASSSASSAAVPASAGGLNWAALARCESGGNPRAVSSTGRYRGLYQFSFVTWAAVGGHGDPAAASPAEQTKRAQILYSRAGRGQWPVCGRNL